MMLTKKLLAGLLILAGAVSAAEPGAGGAELFPFAIPLEKPAGGVVDASSWLGGPAGEGGFVKARGGHFHQGGKPLRLWGVNMAFGGNFPSREDAPLIAAKLARFGVNVVRIHSADIIDGRPSLISRATPDTQHLDAANLKRLDFFVAELKRRGVYVNFNLHVNRTFTAADGVTDADALPPFSKNITLFDRRMIELQKKFATDLLTHVNPYTGHAYAQEPAVAAVEITNENSFFYGWYGGKLDSLPPTYGAVLDIRFAAWLKERYRTTDRLRVAWSEVPEGFSLEDGCARRPQRKAEPAANPAAVRDFLAFLADVEAGYYREMHAHVKDQLKACMPVTGTMYFTMAGGMIQAREMDFVDMHAYWQHPEFAVDWKGKWTIVNSPMVESPAANTLTWLGSARVAGRPFTVSEYNAPWPNFYEAEALPLGAAYAARQAWDGLYAFNFNKDGNFRRDKVESFFDIDGHPVKTAQLIAGAALFARGDVEPATAVRRAKVSRAAAIRSAVDFGWNQGEAALAKLGARETNTVDQRWELEFTAARKDEVVLDAPRGPSTPGPFRWEKGLATLDTPRSKFVIGRPTGKAVELGGAAIELLPTPTNFATVSMHSMDAPASPISVARETLIIAAGRTQNTGMKWDAEFHSAFEDSGHAPALTEGVAARVALDEDAGEHVRVWALDPGGVPGQELTVERRNGRASFLLDPKLRTIWYLVRREK